MKRPQTNHTAIAAACRANPGQWQTVGEYSSTQSAHGAARYIQTAITKNPKYTSPYAPAGAFEARHALTEFGAMVQARYVGDQDQAWADAIAALTNTTTTGDHT